jgi:hypothetical protein
MTRSTGLSLNPGADGRAAELAVERAAALRLHGQAVVLVDVQQLEARHRRARQIERRAARVVERVETAVAQIADQARPHRLALAEDDGVGVRRGFVRHRGDVQAAEDDLGAGGAITVGELVGFFDLRAEAGDGDGVELSRQPRRGMHGGHVDVRDVDAVGRRAGQRQQAEARQRRHDLRSLHESRQRQAESSELRIVRADAAHGQKSEFHDSHPARSAASPTSTPATGIGKRCRKPRRHAVRKQHADIVATATRNPAEATRACPAGMGTIATLSAKSTFTNPRPKNAMWPRRIMRRRSEA